MKKVLWLMILIPTLTLTACFSDNDDEPTGVPDESGPALPEVTAMPPEPDDTGDDGEETGADDFPASADDSGYPAPQLPTRILPAYPVPEATVQVADAYPGGYAIVIHPAGMQCEDPLFPDLEAALEVLEEAGIEVQEVGPVELMVCEACNCPTSLHYRALIDPLDLETALTLGWKRAYQ